MQHKHVLFAHDSPAEPHLPPTQLCLNTSTETHLHTQAVYMVFYLPHWILIKEQKGGSGGSLVTL